MKTESTDYYKELEKSILEDCQKYYSAFIKNSEKNSVSEILNMVCISKDYCYCYLYMIIFIYL
jgi:hypothetical protein